MVIVLGVVAVLTVMVLQLAVSTEILAREAQVAATRSELRFAAESAAEWTVWMYLADRRSNPSRQLGRPLDPALAANQGERWLADGAWHILEDGGAIVVVTINDADTGIDISGNDPGRTLRELLIVDSTDPEVVERVNVFADLAGDYVDGGLDLRRLHGMEKDEYAAAGWPDLPRNAPFQFREELLWLEGIDELMGLTGETHAGRFLQALRLIPPPGTAFDRQRNANFFSASPALLQAKLGLAPADVDELLAARRRWWQGDQTAFDNLPPDMLTRLRSLFSLQESGIVAIRATARWPGGEIVRTIQLVRDCRRPPSAAGDIPAWQNWEKLVDPLVP